MGCQKPRTQGKGDGRRDNFKAFSAGIESIQKTSNWTPHGTVFLKKANRTVVKYG
jgi:hypothetical protein